MQNEQLRVGFFAELHDLAQNRLAIGLAQCALAHDHQALLALNRRMLFAKLRAQVFAARAQMDIVIGQVHSLADQADNRAFGPGFADTRVQHRHFGTWIGADQHDRLRVIDIFNRRRASISRAVARWQFRPIGAAFDTAALPFDKLFQCEGSLDRDKIADQTGQFIALHSFGSHCQGLAPSGGPKLAIFTDVRRVEPLAAQPVPDIARLVGQPFLVHAIMVARQNPHHFAALGIHPDVGTKRIHHIDGLGLGQLPRPGGESIRLRRQRAHRAEVNDIALQFRIERLAQIRGDLRILAPTGLAQFRHARDLSDKPHAAGAGDTARHGSAHQRAQIHIIHGAFRLPEAGEIDTIGHRLILQITFPALVADRAIQRVVDEQKLHHALAGLLDHWRVGLHHWRLPFWAGAQIAHLHGARRGRFWRAAHDLHQTHPAIARDRQPFVITEAGDFDPGLLTGLDQRHRRIHFNLFVVNDDCAQLAHRCGSSLAQVKSAPGVPFPAF